MNIGDDAWFITTSDHFFDPVPSFSAQFKKIDAPVRIVQERNGNPARIFLLYLLHHNIE